MLLGWEAIDADDPDFASLPARLRAVLEAELPLDPMDELVEPLLCLALRRSFVGVVNGRRSVPRGEPHRPWECTKPRTFDM